jgi:hypothetical protein
MTIRREQIAGSQTHSCALSEDNGDVIPEVADLAVEIVRFVVDYQPGIVACEFVDASGRRHTLIEKAPVVSAEDLNADSEYPQPGLARCIVLNRWRDADERDLVSISIADPYGIESREGLSEFVVLQTQISARPRATR